MSGENLPVSSLPFITRVFSGPLCFFICLLKRQGQLEVDAFRLQWDVVPAWAPLTSQPVMDVGREHWAYGKKISTTTGEVKRGQWCHHNATFCLKWSVSLVLSSSSHLEQRSTFIGAILPFMNAFLHVAICHWNTANHKWKQHRRPCEIYSETNTHAEQFWGALRPVAGK